MPRTDQIHTLNFDDIRGRRYGCRWDLLAILRQAVIEITGELLSFGSQTADCLPEATTLRTHAVGNARRCSVFLCCRSNRIGKQRNMISCDLSQLVRQSSSRAFLSPAGLALPETPNGHVGTKLATRRNGVGFRGGNKNMMRLRLVLVSILMLAVTPPTYSDEAKSAYKRGVRAESHTRYDAALEAYKQASALKPRNPKYSTAYLRMRAYVAGQHVQKGQALRDGGKLQEALAEFELAVTIDGTNFLAQQELRSAADLLRKQAEQAAAATPPKPLSSLAKMAEDTEGPADLEPSSDTPLTLRITTTADNIYKTIGKLAGINVLFDIDYKPQRISIELNDVTLREALRMVAMESKTFWRPI